MRSHPYEIVDHLPPAQPTTHSQRSTFLLFHSNSPQSVIHRPIWIEKPLFPFLSQEHLSTFELAIRQQILEYVIRQQILEYVPVPGSFVRDKILQRLVQIMLQDMREKGSSLSSPLSPTFHFRTSLSSSHRTMMLRQRYETRLLVLFIIQCFGPPYFACRTYIYLKCLLLEMDGVGEL